MGDGDLRALRLAVRRAARLAVRFFEGEAAGLAAGVAVPTGVAAGAAGATADFCAASAAIGVATTKPLQSARLMAARERRPKKDFKGTHLALMKTGNDTPGGVRGVSGETKTAAASVLARRQSNGAGLECRHRTFQRGS